jgi:hypothetical protein
MVTLRLVRYPHHQNTTRSAIVDDLLEMAARGQTSSVKAAIEMLSDLHQNGIQSRFLKKMHGVLWELKTRARGGEKGGTRIYLFWLSANQVAVLHGEVKEEDTPSPEILNACARFYASYRAGNDIFEEKTHE